MNGPYIDKDHDLQRESHSPKYSGSKYCPSPLSDTMNPNNDEDYDLQRGSHSPNAK